MPEIIWGACAKGSQWQLALLWLTELGESADIITFNSVLAAFDSSGQHLGCAFSVDDHQHMIEWHFKSWINRRNLLFMAAYGLCKEFSVGWPGFSLALLLADLGGKEPLIWQVQLPQQSWNQLWLHTTQLFLPVLAVVSGNQLLACWTLWISRKWNAAWSATPVPLALATWTLQTPGSEPKKNQISQTQNVPCCLTRRWYVNRDAKIKRVHD